MSPAELARYEMGWSVTRAALESDVHERTIRRIEQGETKPSAEVAKKLADAYGVPVAVLLGVVATSAPEQAA